MQENSGWDLSVRVTYVRAWGAPRMCFKAIYFFEMSVLFETGELNAYVYDGGGLYPQKYV